MPRPITRTYKALVEEAKNYKSVGEWRAAHSGNYTMASRKGWLKKIKKEAGWVEKRETGKAVSRMIDKSVKKRRTKNTVELNVASLETIVGEIKNRGYGVTISAGQ